MSSMCRTRVFKQSADSTNEPFLKSCSALLANVSALSAIQYLRQYVKKNPSQDDPWYVHTKGFISKHFHLRPGNWHINFFFQPETSWTFLIVGSVLRYSYICFLFHEKTQTNNELILIASIFCVTKYTVAVLWGDMFYNRHGHCRVSPTYSTFILLMQIFTKANVQ